VTVLTALLVGRLICVAVRLWNVVHAAAGCCGTCFPRLRCTLNNPKVDATAKVHPTALVEDGAQLGAGCIVHAHAIVSRYCILAEQVEVHPFAVLGGPPQDLGFDPSVNSGVRIGARTVLREHVTINRATRKDGFTEIGADCFIMAAAHAAHDCRIGQRVVMANAVLLGGHVHIGDFAFIGGGAVVHQHCRIGESVMIGGGGRFSEDVAPYCLGAERNEVMGLNLVGLRRRGFTREVLQDIKHAYRRLHGEGGNLRAAATALLEQKAYDSEEARRFLEFFKSGTRRFARPRLGSASATED
jgi:UDP-N-acetylglucosamine acyltransferase